VYKIDPRYGTNDYLSLSAALHKKNMKLVMDYVTNHWGIKHWMITDLPQKIGSISLIITHKLTTKNNHNRYTCCKIDKEACVKGWFVPSMPDLNLSNPLVLKYLTQNAIWWIEYADLDGFRWIPTTTLTQRNCKMDKIHH
jgi:glycosidase